MIIGNSCNGKESLDIDLGMFRNTCANQLVRRQFINDHSLKHTKHNFERLPMIISAINDEANFAINSFKNLKNKPLSQIEILKFINQARKLRFDDNLIDSNQLLKINRPEDAGNDLWLIYNRVQENLTKPGLLVSKDGRLISGVENIKDNIKLNQNLFELAESFA